MKKTDAQSIAFMNNKHYVIQWKMSVRDKWITLDYHKFATLDEAISVMKKKQAAGLACERWRIAESYTVIRYKAVKV